MRVTTRRTIRVAIYLRISQDRAQEEEGIDRQRADCRELVGKHPEWELHEPIFEDNDKSATSGEVRDKFERLIQEIEQGSIQIVVVYTSSRFLRLREERARIINLFREHGVRLVAVKGPGYDFSSADGRYVADLIMAGDAAEAERLSERVRRASQDRAEKGRPHGGPRQFGFTAVGKQIIEEEAAAIRAVVDLVLGDQDRDGINVTAAARWLDEQGIKPPSGAAQWERKTVARLLASPALIGRRTRHGKDIGPANHGPIIDETTWYTLQERLKKNVKTTPANIARHLLSGTARCGECDSAMYSKTQRDPKSGKEYKYIACRKPGCKKSCQDMAQVDAHVTAVSLAYLSREDVRDKLISEAIPDARMFARLEEEIRHVENRMVALTEEFPDLTNDLDRRMFRAGRERLQAELDKLLVRRSQYAETSALAGLVGVRDVTAHWEALTLLKRKELIRTLFTIKIHSANRRHGFDPSLISITPKKIGDAAGRG